MDETLEEEDDEEEEYQQNCKKQKKKKKKKSSNSRSILQFGKAASGTFHLDWRDSITDIQAFAVAVSAFQWSTKER